MKFSNVILITAVVVTIRSQVLPAFGYGEAYKLEWLTQTRISALWRFPTERCGCCTNAGRCSDSVVMFALISRKIGTFPKN